MLSEMSLFNKVVLIIGCGHSWLPELGVSFVESGAETEVVYLDEDEAPRTQEKFCGKATAMVPSTVLEPEKIRQKLDEIIQRHEKIDILVNSFNLEWGKPALDMTLQEWENLINANLRSVFVSCQLVGRKMIQTGKGSIVNIASALGKWGIVNMSAYCSSMGGVFELTRSLAIEWAAKGIRVNAIGVGWRMKQTNTTAGDKLESLLSRYIPMGRKCQSEDVIPLAIFLSSDSASYISGHIYSVDGGLGARG